MISFEQVSFQYPGALFPVLRDITLELPEAEFIVVSGPSGAGKSTFLRCINGLVPHFSGGTLHGRIRVNGLDPATVGPETMCRHVGFVFQEPESQFVMDFVEDELAFALENAAIPPVEMHRRVSDVIGYLDLADLRERRVSSLSGGEKQRVAIAAVLALRPRILVLDEPTSQLDPQSAEEVLEALAHLKRILGLTIVLAEHRLERVLRFADRLVALTGSPSSVLSGLPSQVLANVELSPPVVSLGKRLGWMPLPVTVTQAEAFAGAVSSFGPAMQATAHRAAHDPDKSESLNDHGPDLSFALPVYTHGDVLDMLPLHRVPDAGKGPVVVAESLTVAYDDKLVLRDVSLSLFPGEVTVLMGRNGAGKSTLLKALVGLVSRETGAVWIDGHSTAEQSVADVCRKIAYLPQDPGALLFAETVLEELHITLRNHGMTSLDGGAAPEALVAELGLAHKATAYPRDLSVGERQRAALAAILVTQPPVVFLDEPTRGLDYGSKALLGDLIRRWRNAGRAVLLVTHDVELVAEVADRVVVMDKGTVTAQGAPQKLLRTQSLFTPQIARLFPNTNWLTVEDVLAALGTPD